VQQTGFPSSLMTLTLMSTGPGVELPPTWTKTLHATRYRCFKRPEEILVPEFKKLNNRFDVFL
jgi:hypothetical protein